MLPATKTLCGIFSILIENPVNDVCLGCLCEAISGCNSTAVCTGDVCGLYRITWPFWSDGGNLTSSGESPESETAYANCCRTV
ncbi:uncharacterized protein [Bactrocera oleae]|uniref:uncharacterized protein n=1 Tax=Bactrocera oleae TaxID=104688 RepID=UPI00387E9DC1